jgi:hypothetical protein
MEPGLTATSFGARSAVAPVWEKWVAQDADRHTNDDQIYYATVRALPFAGRIAVRARRNIYDRFIRTMAPTPHTTVLDFGVSEVVSDEANVLEKAYPWQRNITCVGTGQGREIRLHHPDVVYRSITPGQRLPFVDASFDVAVSNAVLEHVGTDADRRFVVRELARVARRLFISIPNRWFPVEHHTGLPFLHYSPSAFRRVVKHTRHAFWSDPARLEFISRQTVRSFWPSEIKAQTSWAGIDLGPFSSNIAIWT